MGAGLKRRLFASASQSAVRVPRFQTFGRERTTSVAGRPSCEARPKRVQTSQGRAGLRYDAPQWPKWRWD